MPGINASSVTGSTITGLGAYRPTRLMDNTQIGRMCGVEADWILERTGIETRYYGGEDEDVAMMAAAAGTKALAMSGVDPAEVDLLVLASATRSRRIPGEAAMIASMIGVPAPGAFDVNAVCAGFAYSLALASNAIRLGEARNALVIGAEKVSHLLNPEDPDTFVIFGDGAGAVLLSRSEDPGVSPVVWGSDGGRRDVLMSNFVAPGVEYVFMDGPLVYKWSTATMPKVARQACEAAGVTLADVKWFVPHQANRRIIDTLTRMLQFPSDQVVRDVVTTGNTSGASIPLALNTLYESGRTQSGDLALLLGFGAGLSYAGQVVRLP
ncbi:beta-ketoacyl-ACP synthase 3 [Actinospica robiniae]|uniref:beta-ketoacyl-ACP synthase 3 n=1 Tax=Actinospica robiniae TaxID=304901 RepID=UPI00040C3992|nr:beta-ketoacyl-ACP synthase 3 [Actinospica robiniae]